jgi:hypothetical protein
MEQLLLCEEPGVSDEAESKVTTAHPAFAGVDALLDGLDVVGGVGGELANAEVGPHLLHGVEFGRVGRQELDPQPVLLCGNVVANELAAVRRESVPDHRDRPADVPAERTEEVDDVLRLHGAVAQGSEEWRPGLVRAPSDRADHRHTLPVHVVGDHGLAPRGAHVERTEGFSEKPLSSTNMRVASRLRAPS